MQSFPCNNLCCCGPGEVSGDYCFCTGGFCTYTWSGNSWDLTDDTCGTSPVTHTGTGNDVGLECECLPPPVDPGENIGDQFASSCGVVGSILP